MEPYLRELSDHAMHVMEAVDTFRDSLTGMLDMYGATALPSFVVL